MHLPSSTYRVQLHRDFALRDLQHITAYLQTLGISTVYASPIMRATPGSLHGYDVTDPHEINPEMGDLDDLKALARELQKNEMFWIQDIVPNHMAFHHHNWRLMDVLERGPGSPFYHYFDIDWDHPLPELQGRVMVPFLGKPLEECIAAGELELALSDSGFELRYFDSAWPLSLPAYALIGEWIREQDPENEISAVFRKMPAAAEGAEYSVWRTSKSEFLLAIHQQPEHQDFLRAFTQGISADRNRIATLLDRLYYRPAYWRDADRFINYRRFFTINELICVRIEDDSVFDEYHAVLLRLYRDRLINGFRIDHIDGLNDPGRYTQRLREVAGDSCYIVVEKILEAGEDMPPHWPVQGTSGYEFLSILNQLLTHREGARKLLEFYRELVPDLPAFDQLIVEKKRNILSQYLHGEWDNLVRLFIHLGLAGQIPPEQVKDALGCLMVCLPVYRIYPDQLPLRGESLVVLHEAFDQALRLGTDCGDELQYLRKLFTESPRDAIQSARILRFMKRMMQFTGPLTAKGVEDTAFYIYNPLISHDEVGDSPAELGISVDAFHERMLHRQESTPLSLNATATHDTKRGEDARVRINVLSRIPDQWRTSVLTWMEMNAAQRGEVNQQPAPTRNDEYFIYQSMLGGFPEDLRVTDDWNSRFRAHLTKALREAKVSTNWADPDEAYEQACIMFHERILEPSHPFLDSFVPLVARVCEHATVYSLVQTLVKLTAPGIPDVYQGGELWDLSFVDPDNRRPVDYQKRMEFLFQLVVKDEKGYDAVREYLGEHRASGIEKLYVTWKTLGFRRSNPNLFVEGDYVPLTITGDESTAAGYARSHNGLWAVVAFPLGDVKRGPAEESVAQDEHYLVFPDEAPADWVNRFTGEVYRDTHQISIAELFGRFPVALLTSVPPA